MCQYIKVQVARAKDDDDSDDDAEGDAPPLLPPEERLFGSSSSSVNGSSSRQFTGLRAFCAQGVPTTSSSTMAASRERTSSNRQVPPGTFRQASGPLGGGYTLGLPESSGRLVEQDACTLPALVDLRRREEQHGVKRQRTLRFTGSNTNLRVTHRHDPATLVAHDTPSLNLPLLLGGPRPDRTPVRVARRLQTYHGGGPAVVPLAKLQHAGTAFRISAAMAGNPLEATHGRGGLYHR